MRARIARLVPTRPGEHAVTAMLFLYIFGVLTFYYILKPLKDGLFLANFPSADLPYPNFLTALSAGTLATLVFKLGRRVSALTLVTATNAVITATLLCFFQAIGGETRYLPYVFYVYVQIVSVLSTTQFWLLAGYVYDNQQAKRLYGLLGAGAIVGAMAGSAISGLLSRELELGTGAMLGICIGIALGLMALGPMIWRFRRPGQREEPRAAARSDRLDELVRMVFGSPHLVLMVALVFTILIASQLADWQVKDALYNRYKALSRIERKEQITAFLANLYLVTNVLGVALQVLATNLVVRRFGITAAIGLLPVAVFTASWGMVFAPGVWAAVAVDGADAVFRYSVTRSGLELLYLPLPPRVRKRLKFFVDVFIDRLGRFVAALVILGVTVKFYPSSARVHWTAAITILLSAVAFACCLGLRRSYAEAFRQQLSRREVDLEEVSRFVTDPASVELLRGALHGANDRQVLYALGLLQSVRGTDFSAEITPLLEHPAAGVRAEAVRTLAALPVGHGERVVPLLGDPDEQVRAAAVEYLCSAPSTSAAQRDRLLAHADPRIRLAAARWLADQPHPDPRLLAPLTAELLAVEGPAAPAARRVAARVAGRLEPSASVAALRGLLGEADPAVVGAAAEAAGKAGHLELLLDIAGMLPDRRRRSAAREALVAYGHRGAGALGDLLVDPEHDPAVRREIPWVLGRIATPRSADILVEQLGTTDPILKYRVVKALNRMHEHHPELPAARSDIARQIQSQTRSYYEALVLWQALQPGANGTRLLVRALRERLDQHLELIFRLLGLQYPQKDIYSAYTALQGERADRRGAAIEFLDTLLRSDLKTLILPLVEESSAERLIERAVAAFGIEAKQPDEALRIILEAGDTWLRACALHEIGDRRLRELRGLVEPLAEDREPLLRETAQWALERCA